MAAACLLGITLTVTACGDDDTAGTTAAPTTAADTTAAPTTAAPTTQAPTTATPAGKPYGGEAIIADDQEPPTLNSFAPGGDNFIVAKIAQLQTEANIMNLGLQSQDLGYKSAQQIVQTQDQNNQTEQMTEAFALNIAKSMDTIPA